MVINLIDTNSSDVELDGRYCPPDVKAHLSGISLARSQSPSTRHSPLRSHSEEDHVIAMAPAGATPPTEKLSGPTMPSGDSALVMTGIGGEGFNGRAASDFIIDAVEKAGKDTQNIDGKATYAMLVKGANSVKFTHGGDCVISIIAKNPDGTVKVTQLTKDQLDTAIGRKPKPDAVADADGHYAESDYKYKVKGGPINTIGSAPHSINELAVEHLDYNVIEANFGKDAVFVLSTDGMYDIIAHDDYQHFEDPELQMRYLEDFQQQSKKHNEEFLQKATEELAAKGYEHTHPEFAQMLARYARTHGSEKKLGSDDDIGIICVSASAPKNIDEQLVAVVSDAVSSSRKEGIEVSRQVIASVAEVARSTAPDRTENVIVLEKFKHKAPVEQHVMCDIKYRMCDVGDAKEPRILFQYDTPPMSEFAGGAYQSHLESIKGRFNVDIVHAQENGKERVYIALRPEDAGQTKDVMDHISHYIFDSMAMSSEWKIDPEMHMLAASDFMEQRIDKDKTAEIRAMLGTGKQQGM